MGGLFMEINNRQIISLATIFIKTFFVIYCAVVYSKNIWIYLYIIALVSVIYIILNLRSIIFETFSTGAQLFLLYLINILSNYMIEVSNLPYLQLIKLGLISIIIIYSSYFLIKNFEDVILKYKKKKEKKYEKEG